MANRGRSLAALAAIGLVSALAARAEEPSRAWIGFRHDAVAVSSTQVGVWVLDIFPGSPAARAGFRSRDAIVAIDGVPLAWNKNEAPTRFRMWLAERRPGERVKFGVRRMLTETEIKTGESIAERLDALPDIERLLAENLGKTVTLRAERKWASLDLDVVLAPPPEESAKPLPRNATLRPDLEATAPGVEAKRAAEAIARAGLERDLSELRERFEKDERGFDDPFRLKTVRYLHRDPLRLPDAARSLAHSLAPAAGSGGLAALAAVATFVLDGTAPVPSEALAAPSRGASCEEHARYMTGLMRRARSLLDRALARLDANERAVIAKEMPEIAARFKQSILLARDRDRDRWERELEAVNAAAKIDGPLLVAAVAELAPLADPAYLSALAADLRAVEVATFGEARAPGRVLFTQTTDVGGVLFAGSGANDHSAEYALLVDLDGDDRYLRRVASGSPTAPVSIALDLGGDDRYSATESFAQGAGLLGVGLLVDRAGDDTYACDEPFAQGAAAAGAGVLVDLAGKDEYRGVHFSQGVGFLRGSGALLDHAGDDRYEATTIAQGFGGPGALGALVDGGGGDRYAALLGRKDTYGQLGIMNGLAQGVGCGVRGYASGGVGALVDCGGDDRYLAGNFSQGGGYYFALGLLADLKAGRDRYDGSRYGQAFGCHSALGALLDEGGDDVYTGCVVALQGSSWDLSVSSFVDAAGDDRYDGAQGFSLGATAHNGFTLFFDGGGKDEYVAPGGLCRSGPNDYHGGPSVSVFVDTTNDGVGVVATASR